MKVTADELAGAAGAPDVRSCDKDGVDVALEVVASVDVITDKEVLTISEGTCVTPGEAGTIA